MSLKDFDTLDFKGSNFGLGSLSVSVTGDNGSIPQTSITIPANAKETGLFSKVAP